MFYFVISLLFLAGFTSGGIPVREYKLPTLGTGARISSLFIASLLLIIYQRFYNTVSFRISNQIDEESIGEIDIRAIKVDEKDLEITNKIDDFGYISRKFNVSTSEFYSYSIEFYITSEDGQIYSGESGHYILIESGDTLYIQIDSNSIEIEPELKLVVERE